MAKIKLSETIHFFPMSTNAPDDVQPLTSKLQLSIENSPLFPGGEVRAQIQGSFADAHPAQLDYLAVSLEGQIAQGDGSTAFVHAAEIAHSRTIAKGSQFIQPAVIHIPQDALISNKPGIVWKLVARAVWNTTQVLHDELELTLVNDQPS